MKTKYSFGSKKERFFFTIYLLLIVVFFVFLELFLRLLGYGIDSRLFHKVNINGISYYRDNTSFINKYYPASSVQIKTEEKNLFPVKKQLGTLRGFVLGGSTAQGYPYASRQSFSAFLERSLAAGASGRHVEVINLGYSAMSSYYVADVAKKVLAYKPDFLLIYAGHNEYYGTVGTMSGQSHAGRRIYLIIREFRIFQCLDRILHPVKKTDNEKTLMQRQFSGAEYPKDFVRDEKTATNFIRNLNDVICLYEKKKIPVILFEPVSNLIDMPPFAGLEDDKLRFQILHCQTALEHGTDEEIANSRRNIAQWQKNANFAYLEAVHLLRDGKNPLSQLVIAKDLDCIPFRARSALTKALSQYAASYRGEKLFYIPTAKRMKDAGILPDNTFFSDHLHFSIEGNRWIAMQAMQVLQPLFQLDKDLCNKLFLMEHEAFLAQFPLSVLDRFRIAQALSALRDNEPFASMLIPYYPRFPVESENPVRQDPALLRAVHGCKSEDFYGNACVFFLQNKRISEAVKTAQAFVDCFPANAKARYFLAESLAAAGMNEAALKEERIASCLKRTQN